jgi:hypothetical protein
MVLRRKGFDSGIGPLCHGGYSASETAAATEHLSDNAASLRHQFAALKDPRG